MLKANAHIADMAPYALANLTAEPGTRLISLSQNESLRSPSPRASQAAITAMGQAALYPDPDWTDLRNAIAQVHAIDPAMILCGAGSMELIAALLHAYASATDTILAPAYSYAFFRTMAHVTQARYLTAPEPDLRVCTQTLLAALTDDTKIVCIANPGNPTGTVIPSQDLRDLRAALPRDTLLIIDEAYGEFATSNEPVFDMAQSGNTVILRTFSKAYGLAGLRVGWGVFPEHIASETRKLLNPNNISAVSQAAAAAAMQDQDYMKKTCSLTADLRTDLIKTCRQLGLEVPESQTNFALIRFDSAASANSADSALRHRGVIMRGMAGYGLPECLRATIGPPEDMKLAIETLKQWHEQRGTK
jgi:histidinol-phosphate aminotransferase